MSQHTLKTWPGYFRAIKRGDLTGCVRNDDRRFAVGDLVLLREWSSVTEQYTGRELVRRVTYVLRDIEGLAPGYACLSFGEP